MDKVVLITGASSGIGLETAKLFQTKNWKVAATMRTPENAGELTNIVDLACIRLDVTDPASIKSAIAETIEKFERTVDSYTESGCPQGGSEPDACAFLAASAEHHFQTISLMLAN